MIFVIICCRWWADGYENAAPRDTTRRGSLSKSTSYPSESAGQTHQTSSTSKTGLSQETISKLSYQRRKKEHEAARSHACDDDPYLDKVPLNDPPKSKRTCEETKVSKQIAVGLFMMHQHRLVFLILLTVCRNILELNGSISFPIDESRQVKF